MLYATLAQLKRHYKMPVIASVMCKWRMSHSYKRRTMDEAIEAARLAFKENLDECQLF